MTPLQTQIREYKDPDEFNKDAAKLAKDGWQVVSTTERKGNPGCGRILVLGPFAWLARPKATMVVTYSRQG